MYIILKRNILYKWNEYENWNDDFGVLQQYDDDDDVMGGLYSIDHGIHGGDTVIQHCDKEE